MIDWRELTPFAFGTAKDTHRIRQVLPQVHRQEFRQASVLDTAADRGLRAVRLARRDKDPGQAPLFEFENDTEIAKEDAEPDIAEKKKKKKKKKQ